MNKVITKATSLEHFLFLNEIETSNIKLYQEAITHSSYLVNHRSVHSYEKLEFLGDAILQLVSSDYIFRKYNKLEPGYQTRLRANVVRTETLASITESLGLVELIRTGSGQMETDVKFSQKVRADVFEAIVAAVYLDKGFRFAAKFIGKYLFDIIDDIHGGHNKDSKTELQEYFQSVSKENIHYQVEQLSDGKFKAKAIHDKIIYGSGIGNTKKEAETQAATDALTKLKSDN
ncbi:hypothetical protein VO56_03135 [Mycoplasmopsis gallinacea]|uniref:Ribonuclease 3 n=1 Tax=Mycoplasmopsis gallinacea TaxID=29556 RepID=A0A0D5ZK90_9BACT|nr:hypothetical protein VO56_03135 [Mycoplasmopsis gallinacea]